jgi:hypothetical protein
MERDYYAVCHRGSPDGTRNSNGKHRFWNPEPVRKLLNRLDRLSAVGALGVRRIGAGQDTRPTTITLERGSQPEPPMLPWRPT